jgi:hypothetical protein
VVFVCEHGTVKSVVAMAYFTQLAQERHLRLRAISRGTNPDSRVPSLVRDGLRSDGLTLGPFTPTQFSPADLSSASPSSPSTSRAWQRSSPADCLPAPGMGCRPSATTMEWRATRSGVASRSSWTRRRSARQVAREHPRRHAEWTGS